MGGALCHKEASVPESRAQNVSDPELLAWVRRATCRTRPGAPHSADQDLLRERPARPSIVSSAVVGSGTTPISLLDPPRPLSAEPTLVTRTPNFCPEKSETSSEAVTWEIVKVVL